MLYGNLAHFGEKMEKIVKMVAMLKNAKKNNNEDYLCWFKF